MLACQGPVWRRTEICHTRRACGKVLTGQRRQRHFSRARHRWLQGSMVCGLGSALTPAGGAPHASSCPCSGPPPECTAPPSSHPLLHPSAGVHSMLGLDWKYADPGNIFVHSSAGMLTHNMTCRPQRAQAHLYQASEQAALGLLWRAYSRYWGDAAQQVLAAWHFGLTSSASLKEKRESRVAMVATRETLARDCPTQLRGPSAKGK